MDFFFNKKNSCSFGCFFKFFNKSAFKYNPLKNNSLKYNPLECKMIDMITKILRHNCYRAINKKNWVE